MRDEMFLIHFSLIKPSAMARKQLLAITVVQNWLVVQERLYFVDVVELPRVQKGVTRP